MTLCPWVSRVFPDATKVEHEGQGTGGAGVGERALEMPSAAEGLALVGTPRL